MLNHFRRIFTAIFLGAVLSISAPQIASGQTNGSFPIGYYTLPAPASGTVDTFIGDSITAGTGATSCSGSSFGNTVTPSGTCFSDLVAANDSVKELNLGISGNCLVLTTTSSSVCNAPSTTTGSLIARYPDIVARVPFNSRVYLQIGTNDALAWSNGDTQVTAAAFRSNLVTVTQAVSAKTGGPWNIVLGEIPYLPAAYQGYIVELNSIIADVASQYGYALAANKSSLQACIIANNASSNAVCNFDTTHPNDKGHAALAAGFESANYQNAIAAQDSNRALLSEIYRSDGARNVSLGGRATLYQTTTGLRNVAGGYFASNSLTTAGDTTCIGDFACSSVSTGGNVSALGSSSLILFHAQGGTGIGYDACGNATTGNFVTCLGYFTQTKAATDTNELVVGANATGIGSNTTAIIPSTTTPGFFAGTGVPTFSAPNASIYMRYDGTTGSRWYANTSGASTSGTTWTALAAP